jgi:competence protein ComEA
MRLPCFLIFLIAALFTCCAPVEKNEKSNTASVSNKAGESVAANAAHHDPCLNINTATREELMRLPGIGEVMSQKIIEHRERHGPFRRPEDVMIIEGFSERKYRSLAGLICVE